MKFGDRLRFLRGNKSQREIAEACGIPQTTYSALESQSDLPKPDMLRRLANALQVHESYFTDERGELDASKRVAIINYIGGLRHFGGEFKTQGIGHVSEANPQREAETIKRILDQAKQLPED